MLKFEYHYQTNSLFTQTPSETPQSIPQSFANEYGGKGFILNPINHWITFTVWTSTIRAFYKEVKPHPSDLWASEIITYYRKDLPKEEVISFTFTPQDQVHKVNNQWIKKNEK